MSVNNYAVFILTNGRPDKVITYNTLRRQGYTGSIYLIVDDEDKTKHQYIEKFGNEVVIFNKKKYASTFDIMDNFDGDRVIVYARNACGDIARKLKLDYFLEFEDDYNHFQYRFPLNYSLLSKQCTNLDGIFAAVIKCLVKTNVSCIAFSQGGDFIGGLGRLYSENYKRKSMNTFFLKVGKKENDLRFIGRMNDDVNTYLTRGKLGSIFMQITDIMVGQRPTQQTSGGNSESYIKYGTYVKSFYSVMAEPSCCKIAIMHSHVNDRIHHKIKWDKAVPKILSGIYAKS